MRRGEGFIEAVARLVVTTRMNEILGICGHCHPLVPFLLLLIHVRLKLVQFLPRSICKLGC